MPLPKMQFTGRPLTGIHNGAMGNDPENQIFHFPRSLSVHFYTFFIVLAQIMSRWTILIFRFP